MIANIPGWQPDFPATMAYHRALLQTLQHGGPPRNWVVKTPLYLVFIDLLFATYPDAWVVHTHRDPLKTEPSSLSTLATVRWERSEDAELLYGDTPLERIAQRWLERGTPLVVATCGVEGAVAYSRGGARRVPARQYRINNLIAHGEAGCTARRFAEHASLDHLPRFKTKTFHGRGGPRMKRKCGESGWNCRGHELLTLYAGKLPRKSDARTRSA